MAEHHSPNDSTLPPNDSTHPSPNAAADYDGIAVENAPIPRAWKWIFVASIAIAPFYMVYSHGSAPGRSAEERYANALAENTRLQFAEIGTLEPDEATLLRFKEKASWVSFGRSVFQTHCISCHGRQGEGNVGPNLTDDHYKNVNNIEDLARVVNEGAGNGAMPPWQGKLHPNEVVLVSAFVATLRGTNVEGGKVHEGKEIAPWPPAPAEEL